jgi:hypothetical protein
MTEAEWQNSIEPRGMLGFVAGKVSTRKWRLYGVACCRRIEHRLKDSLSQRALDLAERLAEGTCDVAEVDVERFFPPPLTTAHDFRRWALEACLKGDAIRVLFPAANCSPLPSAIRNRSFGEKSAQASLARDIFGNLFRPVAFSPEWRTDTAVALARQMYDSRDFSAMPILADALQDAGCDSDDILSHCRDSNATHVRGCWVVDLVLDKS